MNINIVTNLASPRKLLDYDAIVQSARYKDQMSKIIPSDMASFCTGKHTCRVGFPTWNHFKDALEDTTGIDFIKRNDKSQWDLFYLNQTSIKSTFNHLLGLTDSSGRFINVVKAATELNIVKFKPFKYVRYTSGEPVVATTRYWSIVDVYGLICYLDCYMWNEQNGGGGRADPAKTELSDESNDEEYDEAPEESPEEAPEEPPEEAPYEAAKKSTRFTQDEIRVMQTSFAQDGRDGLKKLSLPGRTTEQIMKYFRNQKRINSANNFSSDTVDIGLDEDYLHSVLQENGVQYDKDESAESLVKIAQEKLIITPEKNLDTETLIRNSRYISKDTSLEEIQYIGSSESGHQLLRNLCKAKGLDFSEFDNSDVLAYKLYTHLNGSETVEKPGAHQEKPGAHQEKPGAHQEKPGAHQEKPGEDLPLFSGLVKRKREESRECVDVAYVIAQEVAYDYHQLCKKYGEEQNRWIKVGYTNIYKGAQERLSESGINKNEYEPLPKNAMFTIRLMLEGSEVQEHMKQKKQNNNTLEKWLHQYLQEYNLKNFQQNTRRSEWFCLPIKDLKRLIQKINNLNDEDMFEIETHRVPPKYNGEPWIEP